MTSLRRVEIEARIIFKYHSNSSINHTLVLVSGMMTYYNWYDYRFIAITIVLVSIALTRESVELCYTTTGILGG